MPNVQRPLVLVALVALLVPVAAAAAPTALLRVERRAPDDLVHLRASGVPVVAETPAALLVEGTAEDAARVAALGYRLEVLDPDAGAADYLVVPLAPGSDPLDLESHGTVVLLEDNLAFVRVPRGAPLPAGLEPGCFGVDRMNRDPLGVPTFEIPEVASRATDAATPDPLVQQIVDAVDDAEILAAWQAITDNPPEATRYSPSLGCEDAADYCHAHYAALGLAPQYDLWNAGHAPNVVAEIEGAIEPGKIHVLVGHLDDLPASGVAPGADDNGSGTVTVLEGARVMACYAFRRTVRFLNVTGEEQGLLGSDAYATAAKARGDDIRAVLNFDMNGWEGDGTPVPENLDVSYNGFSQWLGERFAQSATTYGTGLVVDAFSCPSLTASDHASFWEQGYPAIIGITDNHGYCGHAGTYPDYHESTDTIAANGDPTLYYASIRTAVATLAELAGPFVVTFSRGAYACDGAAEVVVADAGLDLDPGTAETVEVVVTSDAEPGGESLTLVERGPSSKLFSGSIPLSTAPAVPGDGVLAVAEGDVLRTSYVDPLDCAGNADAAYEATATVDCTGPAIDGVGETGVTGTEATIVFATGEPAAGTVVWGETVPPGQVEEGPAERTSHAIRLTGLQECTTYRYEVRATDEAGNVAVADDGGRYFAFETLGDFGQGLQPCSAGQVTVADPAASCSGTIAFEVVDLDLNLDPLAVETATVRLTSTTETSEEVVTVVETGPNTSRFAGSIATATGAPAPDGVLQTADGDLATVTYADADDGTGGAGLAYATATVDCAGPRVENLRIESITDARATVAFATDEPADVVIAWGATPALGESAAGAPGATAHAVLVNRLGTCAETWFRVHAVDRFGHETVADDGGAPYRFQCGTIPGLYWKDDFESPTPVWTLGGEWEVGPPEGRGGSAGRPDPASAYNHDRVLGHDLSGLGAYPGDFEPGTQETAVSPEFDASDWTNTELRIHRRLNTGSGDDAAIVVRVPQGYPVYRSAGATVQDADWSVRTFDLAALVDGKRRVTIEFSQTAGATGQYSGWNVDDVILKDGSLPPYGPCGACGSAPSFGGAASASDDDACAASGVTVRWAPAIAWGSGAGGTYAVHRGETPGFVPSPANLVASGIPGTSWTDTTLAPGATGHYVVRAENDETCAGGPANGGVTDGNVRTVVAADADSHPVPGAVAGVTVGKIGAAHLRVAWDGDGAAGTYRVYRSGSPQPGTFAVAGTTAEARFDDLDAGADHETYFYVVRAVSPCGVEGP